MFSCYAGIGRFPKCGERARRRITSHPGRSMEAPPPTAIRPRTRPHRASWDYGAAVAEAARRQAKLHEAKIAAAMACAEAEADADAKERRVLAAKLLVMDSAKARAARRASVENKRDLTQSLEVLRGLLASQLCSGQRLDTWLASVKSANSVLRRPLNTQTHSSSLTGSPHHPQSVNPITPHANPI